MTDRAGLRWAMADSQACGIRTVVLFLRLDSGTEMQLYANMTSQMSGFVNSPQGITASTPFENEFFYAPGFIDGGFADANGALATR